MPLSVKVDVSSAKIHCFMLTELQAEQLAQLGLGDEDVEAWRSSGRSGDEFGDWLIDRIARRPSGTRARETYGAETVHDFARRAILATLALGPGDDLLEIGCGGGLLLRDALAAGARAVGLDHNPEMVALARETAARAAVVLGSAEHLPFPDASFSAVAMSIVFLFFEEPLVILRECHRVLRPDGRLAVYTTGPELRGTPAAPEPVASHGHFYSDAELAALARQAAFDDVVAVTDRGGQLLTARKAGPPRPSKDAPHPHRSAESAINGAIVCRRFCTRDRYVRAGLASFVPI